jgi:perosamine synthetase
MWFYTIKVPSKDKNPLMKHLLTKGIQVRPIWKLIHTLPMYKKCESYDIKEAVNAYNTCINLPCSVNLTSNDIKYVSESIKEYFNK